MAKRGVGLVIVGAGFVAFHAGAGTQQCNTACQTKMTDCILACDGRLSCELDCKSKAIGCVERCSSNTAAVASDPWPGPPGDAGDDLDARAAIDARASTDGRASTD